MIVNLDDSRKVHKSIIVHDAFEVKSNHISCFVLYTAAIVSLNHFCVPSKNGALAV
jgi:hypothetical protein